MRLIAERSRLAGAVRIPGSKSHTVRAVLLAALADGTSRIEEPLTSEDTLSSLIAAKGFGAEVVQEPGLWTVRGAGGAPTAREQLIDVGNSGTTLYIALALAALAGDGVIHFDGDAQIRRRSASNLLDALEALGANPDAEGDNGCCPINMRGTWRGGEVTIECPTSQYLTALLLAAPLAEGETVIHVPLLYEQPYVEMTLRWLESLDIAIEYAPDYSRFRIPGGQRYPAFERAIPADFSSATFFLCAAAVTGSELLVQGLDMSDSQGDKAVVDYLRAMGAEIREEEDGLRVMGGCRLHGAELDLNATPDALPAMAVTAALAEGTTILGNAPQARIKETDRIAVMATELAKLGVKVEEREDGLVIGGGTLRGGDVGGHGDHRIVMSFAVAGLAAPGPVSVDTAESAAVTFPNFTELMQGIGGQVEARSV